MHTFCSFFYFFAGDIFPACVYIGEGSSKAIAGTLPYCFQSSFQKGGYNNYIGFMPGRIKNQDTSVTAIKPYQHNILQRLSLCDLFQITVPGVTGDPISLENLDALASLTRKNRKIHVFRRFVFL